MVGRLIDGVSKLDGDLDARQVTITFDEAGVSLDEMKDALERGGYPTEE
ncbi:MAG: hypothetical protein IIB28_10130 [Chloroflexi bacterium]|nr:hypothetical protein [Chloroflexota bacterium]